MTDADTPGEGGLRAVLLANRASLLRFLQARGAGDQAEDIWQELWVKLTERPPVVPVSEPLAYLYRVAHNLMHDRNRTEMRRRDRDLAWCAGGDADPAPRTDDALIAREALARAERTLEVLGERTRSIFERFRIGEMPQKAIALEEGISLSAVEKHLQRAYRALAELSSRADAEPSPSRRPSAKGGRDGS